MNRRSFLRALGLSSIAAPVMAQAARPPVTVVGDLGVQINVAGADAAQSAAVAGHDRYVIAYSEEGSKVYVGDDLAEGQRRFDAIFKEVFARCPTA